MPMKMSPEEEIVDQKIKAANQLPETDPNKYKLLTQLFKEFEGFQEARRNNYLGLVDKGRSVTARDPGNAAYSQGADDLRQGRALTVSNNMQEGDPEYFDSPQPASPSVTPQVKPTLVSNTPTPPQQAPAAPQAPAKTVPFRISPYDMPKASRTDLQRYADEVLDEYDTIENNARLERDKILAQPFDLSKETAIRDIDATIQRINHSRTMILSNNPWFKRGASKEMMAAPQAEEPGLLSRIFEGAKDTAKFAIQHPKNALAHAYLGAKEFASLPLRGLEGLMDADIPGIHARKNIEEHQAGLAEADRAAGIDPRGTGPVVSEVAGQMAVPLPFKLFKPVPGIVSKETAKNVGKGAAFGGGAYATERIAHDEPVDDAGLATSGGIGAGLGVLGSILSRGKAKPAPSAGGSGPTGGGPVEPPGPREPRGIEYKDTTAGTFGPKGEFYGSPPPKALPAPEAPGRSHFKEMVDAIRSKPEGEPLTPEEQRFLTLIGREAKHEPPNVGGTHEAIDDPRVARTASAASEVAERPSSPPYPGSIYGLPGVKQPEPPVAEGESKLAKILGRGKVERAPKLVEPKEEVITTTNYKVEEAKPQPKVEAKPAPVVAKAKEVDTKVSEAEQELSLGEVLAGKKDIKDVPVQRDPKSEAPSPVKASEPIVPGALVEQLQAKTDLLPDEAKRVAAKGPKHVKEFLARAESSKPPSVKPQEATKPEPPSALIDFFGERSPGKIAKTKPGKDVKAIYEEQLAKGKTPEKAKEIAEFKADQKMEGAAAVPVQTQKLEEFIKAKGYQLKEKEPFPGEKSYDVIDPKTGNTIARGDRSAILNALNVHNEGKGVKLHSFPGDLGSFKEMFTGLLEKSGAKLPEGVGVDKQPARRSLANKVLQAVETPDFLMRKYAPGKDIVSETSWAERQIGRRVNDLLYKEGPGGYERTKLFRYFEMPEADRAKVDKVLVLGDKRGEVFSDAVLRKVGLTDDQISAYRGVREGLDAARTWTKGADPDLDIGEIKGYIPRVWHGQMEVYVNGKKHLRSDGTSAFGTMREASAEAFEIKKGDPKAKIEIKFFADPEYLGGRAFQDAQVISRIKSNLERMGSSAAADVDKAYEMGRDLKGFSKHLEARKGEIGYETEGLDKVLFNYFHQAAKSVEMRHVREVAKSVIKDHARELTPDQVRYLQNYVERVAGRPTWDEIVIHDMIGSTGLGKWLDPVKGSKVLHDTRQLINHLNLGLGNISWAVVNVDSLVRHVWPALQREAHASGFKGEGAFAAEKYLSEGIKDFFTNPQLKQKLAHYGVVDIQHMSEQRPQVGHQFGKGEWTPSRVSMALGTMTEEFVRSVTAISRYKMGLAHGLSDTEAMKAAARFVDETSGRYTRAGKPAAFTGAIGETVAMYKTYMSVFAQNAWKAFGGAAHDPGTFVRYMIATLGISGLLGLPGVDDLDEIITKHWGWSPIEKMQKNLPQGILTGIASVAPGAAGFPQLNVDLSKKAGMGDLIPNDTWSALGPVIGRIGNVISDVSKGEYKEAALDLLPNSLKGAVGVIRGSDQGVVMGKYDKPSSRLEPGQEIPKVMGFPPVSEVEDQRVVSRNANKEAHRNNRLKVLKHKVVQGTASESEMQEFYSLGGSSKMLKNEQKQEQQTPRERQFQHLPKILKREAAYD